MTANLRTYKWSLCLTKCLLQRKNKLQVWQEELSWSNSTPRTRSSLLNLKERTSSNNLLSRSAATTILMNIRSGSTLCHQTPVAHKAKKMAASNSFNRSSNWPRVMIITKPFLVRIISLLVPVSPKMTLSSSTPKHRSKVKKMKTKEVSQKGWSIEMIKAMRTRSWYTVSRNQVIIS